MKRTRGAHLDFSDNYSLPPAALPGSPGAPLMTQEDEVPGTHKALQVQPAPMHPACSTAVKQQGVTFVENFRSFKDITADPLIHSI